MLGTHILAFCLLNAHHGVICALFHPLSRTPHTHRKFISLPSTKGEEARCPQNDLILLLPQKPCEASFFYGWF